MDAREHEVRRRMDAHELYVDAGEGLEALEEERIRGKELAHAYNATGPREVDERRRLLHELFEAVGEGAWVEPPLHVAYGSRVRLGAHVYVNFGLTLVDDVEVVIGDRVMIAPNVTISTTGHPVHPELRRDGTQFSAPVVIEDDVWIGANCVLLDGALLRRGCVIGAGSLVRGEVAAYTVNAGNPLLRLGVRQ